jgi:hypothetical protein
LKFFDPLRHFNNFFATGKLIPGFEFNQIRRVMLNPFPPDDPYVGIRAAQTQSLFFPSCFPDEILVRILEYTLVFDRSITLTKAIDDKHTIVVGHHLRTCLAGEHLSRYTVLGQRFSTISSIHRSWFCRNFFSGKEIPLVAPASVLDVLVVCKKLNDIGAQIFYQKNTFTFPDCGTLLDISDEIPTRSNLIKRVQFCFTSHLGTNKFYELNVALPMLESLDVHINVKSLDISAHKGVKGLYAAWGLARMAHAIDRLQVLNITGTDWITRDNNDDGEYVDIMDPAAAGPWLFKEMTRNTVKIDLFANNQQEIPRPVDTGYQKYLKTSGIPAAPVSLNPFQKKS